MPDIDLSTILADGDYLQRVSDDLVGSPVLGVPTGGATGTQLVKASATNGDAAWQTKSVIDVRDYGAKGDGTTNDTVAVTAAVTAANVSGGIVSFPKGTYLTDALPALATNVTLQGVGRSSMITHRGGAAANAHLLTTATDAARVQVRDLMINGNRSGQTNAVNAIHFTNAAGTSGTNARHVINNVHIENVKGVGLYLGAYMRACQINTVSVYFADVYGVQLEAFADSQISNIEVGQSGGHGFYIHSANTIELSNTRSWFSGRLSTGAGGYGYYVHDGSNIQMSNPLSQENSGNGFTFWGNTAPLRGLVVTGAFSDADNAALSTFAGFSLNNVEKPILSGAVRKHTGGVGTPANALALTGGTIGYTIDLVYSDLSGYPIVGADVGKGEIRLGRQPVAATWAASYTPQPYTNGTIRMTVSGATTINAPNMNPVIPGWRIRTIFKQDVTGGRVVTWNAIYKTLGADVTTANLTNIRDFEYDGTNWVQVSATLGI